MKISTSLAASTALYGLGENSVLGYSLRLPSTHAQHSASLPARHRRHCHMFMHAVCACLRLCHPCYHGRCIQPGHNATICALNKCRTSDLSYTMVIVNCAVQERPSTRQAPLPYPEMAASSPCGTMMWQRSTRVSTCTAATPLYCSCFKVGLVAVGPTRVAPARHS